MANSLITPDVIARESLFHLHNNCVAAKLVDRQYKHEFVKVGDSVRVRKPVKFYAADGATRVNQDINEESTNITVDERKHVSWEFSMEALTLEVEEYSERYIKPAMIVLANEMDMSILRTGAEAFFNRVGEPGTTPSSFSDLGDAAERMDTMSVPDDGQRNVILNPKARWAISDTIGSTVFNAEMVGDMYRKGRLGNLANLEIYGSQNVHRHTTGDHNGTPLVNDASFTNGSNQIAIDGGDASATTGYLRAGDVITIAGVNSVNPVNRQDTGDSAQFVVLEDADTNGSGEVTVTVYPELNDGSVTATQAYQTVTDLPADNAAVTVVGSADTAYPQNLAFHRNALSLVTVPLQLPESAGFKARATWDGYSIRVVKDYDIDNDKEVIRLDVLWGVDGIYPELGVRLDG